MSFADLKRNSGKDSLKRLSEELSKVNQKGGGNTDDRYWQPSVDKAGNGVATIRFLPASEGESSPFVVIYSHGFKGPGGWYIENSLTTIGEKDPCGEYNSMLWNSGIEANKKIVSGGGTKDSPGTKRKTTYISNIYVVDDPANPDNNGKVFLYKYGKKIFDMLNDAAFPKFGEEPFDPFDFWTGANFKIRIRNVEGYRNYDKSSFETPAPLMDDDSEMEAIWRKQYSLSELLDRKNFKSYEKLKERLDIVLGSAGARVVTPTASELPEQKAVEPKSLESKFASKSDDEDDYNLDDFEKLLNDDD